MADSVAYPDSRYYQDAAIRATFEKIICSKQNGVPARALLSMATGAGKTIIAANLLWRLHEAEELPKPALFLCDRDELREQAYNKLKAVFGDNARIVKTENGQNAAKNARIHIATYQTLGLDEDTEEEKIASFLTEFYPDDAFSVIIIDECHRSAWGRWSEVLKRSPNAIKAQFFSLEDARNAAKTQLYELVNLANAIIRQSVEHPDTDSAKLGDVLSEVKQGIGKTWAKYPVLGATRAGLALAKEPVGKSPERYKPVICGTVFYNPMRIMIGSIAMVDEYDTPGITSPDYVALRGKPGLVDSRWFYYWLRSPYGVSCIASLARGAVRERMLFNRLAEGNIELPPYDVQVAAAKALAELKPMRCAIEKQLNEINLLPAKILSRAFDASA